MKFLVGSYTVVQLAFLSLSWEAGQWPLALDLGLLPTNVSQCKVA